MSESEKDPVCGMIVLPERGLSTVHNGQTIYFCSAYCKSKFLQQPEKYFQGLIRPSQEEPEELRQIGYFSMEVAIESGMPTYSGGLGVLAGDSLRSCADLRVPIVGVTLLCRKGYFDQKLDEWGGQQEQPVQWSPEHLLKPLPQTATVNIEQRAVQIRAWQHDIVGLSGYIVPLILLDSNLEGNTDYDRALTDSLYGGDQRYRLAQETLLGIGGVKILAALGYAGIQKFHMNEGHASLLVLELLRRQSGAQADWDFTAVRNQCVFTTHTPVPAGHDQFGYDLVQRVLGQVVPFEILQMLGDPNRLNMTLLGLNLSRYVNGVAKRHEEVSREMFPGYPIHHITNGVHSWTWTCNSLRVLYDKHIPGWSNDPAMLRNALSIPKDEIWAAHMLAKKRLLDLVKARTGRSLSPETLTIGFARRATQYKRADLIFSDVNRLLAIAKQAGPIQFVFAGKAHPQDQSGKELIRHIVAVSRQLRDQIPIVYLENHDMELAKLLVSGVDLWLNTPERPLEASGTSGMKAAHNGVPSFSTLDGWWVEGYIEGLTGWSIGSRETASSAHGSASQQDAESLYHKLNNVILPLFYLNRDQWIDVVRHSIALNASFFNTHRMVQQYVTNAYLA